ncbi:MAG: ABC transporter ATP-binding protein [Burkholderiaceae bacterium]
MSQPSQPSPPVLRLSGITKRFGPLLANDAVSLSLARGEILALLGENGAGKSTLMMITFGQYRADAGTVEIDGQPLPPGDAAAALAAGIAMVHQHFTLADNLTVLENVMIGTESLARPMADRATARAKLTELAARFGLAADPDALVGRLSVGEKQRIEILKALYRGARVLILDEPTAVLTPQESEQLFATLHRFVAEGLAILFISHKLDEVLAVSDRVAVLRAGQLIAEMPRSETDKTSLAELMVGRELPTLPPKTEHEAGPVLLAMQDVHARAEHGRSRLRGASLEVRGGEILAIAGVAGNGQGALAETLFGLIRPRSGQLTLAGAAYPKNARATVAAGIARVPEDRRAQGSVGDMSLTENSVLDRVGSPAFSRLGWLRGSAIAAFARQLIADFDVRGGDASTAARLLSGGNLQKLVLGRALRNPHEGPRLIVVDQPTWGLDVGAVASIHARLIAASAAGDAVLVISEDLDEIFALADRVAVINHGRIVETRPVHDWTLAELGLAMAEHRAA